MNILEAAKTGDITTIEQFLEELSLLSWALWEAKENKHDKIVKRLERVTVIYNTKKRFIKGKL